MQRRPSVSKKRAAIYRGGLPRHRGSTPYTEEAFCVVEEASVSLKRSAVYRGGLLCHRGGPTCTQRRPAACR